MFRVTGVYDRYWQTEVAELDKTKPLTEEQKKDPAQLAARDVELEQRTFDKLKDNSPRSSRSTARPPASRRAISSRRPTRRCSPPTAARSTAGSRRRRTTSPSGSSSRKTRKPRPRNCTWPCSRGCRRTRKRAEVANYLNRPREGQSGGRPGAGLGAVELGRVSIQSLTTTLRRTDHAMNVNYACKSPEHTIARRQFLGTLAAAGAGACAGGLGVFSTPAIADQLKSDQKRIVVFNMHGGLSQLESWDPKPGTDTGGPFRAIPTSVPGIHISRAAAGHGQADAPPVPGPRRQHQRRRSRQGRVHDAHRPPADAGGRLSADRRGRRQGARAGRQLAARPHPDHARRRRRPRQRRRLSRPQVLQRSARQRQPAAEHGAAREPVAKRPTRPGRISAGTSTSGSSIAAARP